MHTNDYIVLLHKQQTGEITPPEQVLLQDWLSQSPENERLAIDMQEAWERSAGYEIPVQPDLDAAYQRVQARIREEAPVIAPMRVLTFSQKMMRLAAAAAVLLLGVWSFQQFYAPAAPEMLAVVSGSETKEVLLPDGSKVWMRPGSALHYAADFSGAERLVELRGEAYFDVVRNPDKIFRVEIGAQKSAVEVLGTSFLIRQNDVETAVTVRSGTVRFYPEKSSQGLLLNMGDKAVLQQKERRVITEKVVTFNELSWQTGGLEFVKTPMKQVISDLETYYGVEIKLLNTGLQHCKHTAPLTSQPLEKVLESLSLTYQLDVKQTGPKQYELTGGNCQ